MQKVARELSSIPELEKSPRGGNDSPLQYSCLGNPMDKEAWLQSMGCKESDMTERLSRHRDQSVTEA